VSNPFFLTRQTANLMEDFARELEQGSALFLLYGDDMVGKTRLLQELYRTRLGERPVHWLDLGATDIDASDNETRPERSDEIEALFKSAASGDIFIADHFEQALKKTRHQLLLSWSTDGIDKQLNLIIASSIEGFNELRQLSQQYQVQVQSSQLTPLTGDEVDAFLGFYLYPDNPAGKLSIPSPLRKQLASTHGVIGRVIEIADSNRGQIDIAASAVSGSAQRGRRILLSAVVLCALAIGAGWYLAGWPPGVVVEALAPNGPLTDSAISAQPETNSAIDDRATETIAAVQQQAPTDAAVEPEPDARTEPESVATSGADDEPTTLAASDVVASDDASAGVEPASETGGQPGGGVKPAPAPVAEAATQEQFKVVSEPGTALDTDAVIVMQPRTDPPVEIESNQQRFDLLLQESLAWINDRDDITGTIQILLLSHNSFNVDNFYAYVANLAERQVDVDKLRVFKAYIGNAEVYNVVYGEYASRRAAISSIEQLPAVLRDAAPIPRSVGGLWQEIRRLEVKN